MRIWDTRPATEKGLAILAGSVDSVARYQQYVGLAANLFVFMPWGRRHELEADRIGLIYMARAGYDPREAIDFWKRMEAASGGGPPEFLSTHPGGATRIQELYKQMPEALAEYSKARGSSPDQL